MNSNNPYCVATQKREANCYSLKAKVPQGPLHCNRLILPVGEIQWLNVLHLNTASETHIPLGFQGNRMKYNMAIVSYSIVLGKYGDSCQGRGFEKRPRFHRGQI